MEQKITIQDYIKSIKELKRMGSYIVKTSNNIMTTTNIVQLTTALIITTILIVGVGAVDVGAQGTQEAQTDISLFDAIGIMTSILTGVVILVGAVLGGYFMLTRTTEKRTKELLLPIKQDIRDIKQSITTITTTISNNDNIGEYALGHSPRQLTEKGKELLANSGCKLYLYRHFKEDLYKEFEGIDTAWEVQRKATRVVIEKIQDDKDKDIEPIHQFVFDNGLSLNNIIVVMSIELRNMVLNEKGIQIKEPEKQEATTNK